jgi:hypothetical protein
LHWQLLPQLQVFGPVQLQVEPDPQPQPIFNLLVVGLKGLGYF